MEWLFQPLRWKNKKNGKCWLQSNIWYQVSWIFDHASSWWGILQFMYILFTWWSHTTTCFESSFFYTNKHIHLHTEIHVTDTWTCYPIQTHLHTHSYMYIPIHIHTQTHKMRNKHHTCMYMHWVQLPALYKKEF